MPIITTRIAPGVLHAKTIGQASFSEMSESRAEGMRLLEDAGELEWVLIMDVIDAKSSSGPRSGPQGNDMNVDSLRGVTQKNKEQHLLGYVVLGANPALKLIMRTYGVLFRVDMYFETTHDGALKVANRLLDKYRQDHPVAT
jgi:hypothetical protein